MLMKKLYLLIGILACATSAQAQCAHDPTITPSNLILCPNESDTLWTQAYDSYQWYRGGNPIPGATNQYLVVSYANDAGYNFTVEATLNSCTEMSPQVLVDGWAFLGPVVMTAGDPGTVDGNGVQHNCPGDTVILVFMQPYDINIQWYDNGSPIAGANDDTLIVTQGGDFTVCGSPSICPNYNACLGVTVSIQFWPVITPTIAMQGNMLVATPGNAAAYQWYLNGNMINGATASSYQPTGPGNYTVEITDANGCRFMSAPFNITGIEEKGSGALHGLYPNPAGNELNLVLGKENGTLLAFIRDVTGREVLREQISASSMRTINVESLQPGIYFVELQDEQGSRRGSARFVKKH